MSVLDTITLEERARQLRHPIGSIGLAVADAISAQNRNANLRAVRELAVQRDARVLELGCGAGNMAEFVVSQAERVRYIGMDSSLTMIDTANSRNAHLILQGLAEFHNVTAEEMPFETDMFNYVFSIGVAHFWPDPVKVLTEVHRVLQSGGLMLTGCLSPERAPPFAKAEFGFYLHDPQSWRSFCLEAGFRDVKVETGNIGSESGPQVIELTARAQSNFSRH